jgi:isopentenyldiphosphate isomerase
MNDDPGTELVDIVNDAGQTVGTVTRHEVRTRRLPHRCAYVVVFNRRGELFIHLRTPSKDVYPSHWDVTVGGVLAAGEAFDAGSRREVHEELGVEAAPEALFPFRYADAASVVQGMVYRLVHEGPFWLQAEEIVRGEFLPLGEVAARTAREPFCPDGLAVLAEYQHRYPDQRSGMMP